MIINRVSSNLKTVLSVIDIWLSSWLTLLYGDLFHYYSQMFTTWHSSKNVCRWFARKLRKNEASSLEQRFGFQPCDGKNVRCPKKGFHPEEPPQFQPKNALSTQGVRILKLEAAFACNRFSGQVPPWHLPNCKYCFGWRVCDRFFCACLMCIVCA